MKVRKLNLDFDDKLHPIEITTRQNLLSEIFEGKWVTRYKGRGMEFSEYRNYIYGDDANNIDWKASLRSNNLLVRQFEQDRGVNALFVFDVSDNMLFSSRNDGKMKVEYAAELIVGMARPILNSGNAVGLMMFNNNIVKKVDPNIGLAVEHQIKNLLANPENYGGEFNFGKMMKVLLNLKQRRLVIIIISDFIGLKKGWHKYIEILNEKYDIIGIMIKDHRDRYLPERGQVVVQDPSTDKRIYVDAAKYGKLYHETILKEEINIARLFRVMKCDLLRLETTEDAFSKLVKFFRKRIVVNS